MNSGVQAVTKILFSEHRTPVRRSSYRQEQQPTNAVTSRQATTRNIAVTGNTTAASASFDATSADGSHDRAEFSLARVDRRHLRPQAQ